MLVRLPRFGFLGHGFFAFSAPLLAGHTKANGAASAGSPAPTRPDAIGKGSFLRGSLKTSLVVLFLGGTANRKVLL